jgi:1-acyl-sn-glycerol-3-phosphate acyltransferase
MNFYTFGRGLAGFISRLVFSVKFEGLENIPKSGGYIIACNHLSLFDPIIMAVKVPRQINFFAKAELVKTPVFGRIIKSLGVIPVERGAGDSGAIDNAAKKLENGGVLGLFPEGTRSKDGKPMRAKSGVAVIAGRTGADILPCAVSYPKGRYFRAPVIMRYGEIIPIKSLGVNADSPATIKMAAKKIMEHITYLMVAGDF